MTFPSTSPGLRYSSRRGWRRWLLLAAGLALLLAGCAQAGDMAVQPRYDPLEDSAFFADGRSARPFVPGSVTQTELRVDDPLLTGLDVNGEPFVGFPAEVTNEQVQRGGERFTIYCEPCHGADGTGTGRVVAFGFPQPPSLLDEQAQSMPEGELFDVITNGRGVMFPYGYRVKAADRWAVIAYLRAMQLKNGPPAEDLTPEELQQLGTQP